MPRISIGRVTIELTLVADARGAKLATSTLDGCSHIARTSCKIVPCRCCNLDSSSGWGTNMKQSSLLATGWGRSPRGSRTASAGGNGAIGAGPPSVCQGGSLRACVRMCTHRHCRCIRSAHPLLFQLSFLHPWCSENGVDCGGLGSESVWVATRKRAPEAL